MLCLSPKKETPTDIDGIKVASRQSIKSRQRLLCKTRRQNNKCLRVKNKVLRMYVTLAVVLV